VKFLETRDDTYFGYGANCISVHFKTGECRFLDLQEIFAVKPFDQEEGRHGSVVLPARGRMLEQEVDRRQGGWTRTQAGP
jgi:hypothetical protein